MHNKYVLITGGTGGIGKQTAIGLAKLGAYVIVNGRDPKRGEQAVRDIQIASGNQNIELLCTDMSEQSAVRQMAADYQSRFPRLDVLINNAGVVPKVRQLTSDGVETAFAVNVIAPWLLTTLLLDMLKASRPARVINLAGGLPFGNVNLENLQSEKKFGGFSTYSHTKRAMYAMSLAFVRQLEGTGVTLNVAYPGRAETDIMKPQSEPPLPLRIVFGVVNRFVPHGEETVIQAARCSIYLASSSEVEGKTGGFYNPNTKAGKFPASARDEATQREVMAAVTRRTSHSEQVHV